MSSKRVTEYFYDSTELLENPTDVFERIRQDGDVVWCKPLRHWIVTSYAEATQALANPLLNVTNALDGFKYLENKTGVNLSSSFKVLNWIPFLHNGEHHSKRRALYARVLADIKTEYIRLFERSSRTRLQSLLVKKEGDFVTDYADHLHTDAIGQMCGFSPSDIAWIVERSSTQGTVDFACRLGDSVDANIRVAEIFEHARPLVISNQTSFLIQVIKQQLQNACLEDSIDKQIEFLLSIIFLGGDAVSGSLSIGLTEMLDAHNGIIQAKDWENSAWGLEELLRLSSTIQLTNRVATKTTTIGDQTIKEGEAVLIFFPAANRDPKNFGCPHQASTDHKVNMSFGSGRHICTGKPMTKLAINKAINHLKELTQIQELPGRTLAQSKTVRKYQHLPISIQGEIHDS